MENNIVKKENIFKKPWIHSLIAMVAIFGLLAVFLIWQSNKNIVFIENSLLDAPIINVSPTTAGILNELYVKEGDRIAINGEIALVGSQIIYSKTGGIVSNAPRVVGAYFNPGQTVVSIVNDNEMRVIGSVDETKGLKDLLIGQKAIFTVDAFPGKTYLGIVDEVSPVSDDTGVAFSISDKRPIKKFDIKVRFNISEYPELKSGMSAKITVYTK